MTICSNYVMLIVNHVISQQPHFRCFFRHLGGEKKSTACPDLKWGERALRIRLILQGPGNKFNDMIMILDPIKIQETLK